MHQGYRENGDGCAFGRETMNSAWQRAAAKNEKNSRAAASQKAKKRPKFTVCFAQPMRSRRAATCSVRVPKNRKWHMILEHRNVCMRDIDAIFVLNPSHLVTASANLFSRANSCVRFCFGSCGVSARCGSSVARFSVCIFKIKQMSATNKFTSRADAEFITNKLFALEFMRAAN